MVVATHGLICKCNSVILGLATSKYILLIALQGSSCNFFTSLIFDSLWHTSQASTLLASLMVFVSQGRYQKIAKVIGN